MTCRQVHRHLLAWLEGELDEATWLTMAQHVDTCERCQAEAQRWRQMMTMLRAVAHSDGVPPIPPRLWQQLTPRRKRLPSFVSVFVTACLAFLLGWHARSLALSVTPAQESAKETKRSAITAQSVASQQRYSLSVPVRSGSWEREQQGAETPIAKQPFALAQAERQHSRPLTLNGATAVAWDKGVRNQHAWQAMLHPSASRNERRPDEGAGEEQLPPQQLSEWQSTEDAGEVANAVLWLFVPLGATNAPEESLPYRIFVQVTDPQTQTVRTVQVDTTDPHHIVAEWQEWDTANVPTQITPLNAR